MQHIHELLPLSSRPLSIWHPSHAPLLIRVEVDRSKKLSHNLRVKVKVERDDLLNTKLVGVERHLWDHKNPYYGCRGAGLRGEQG